MAEYEVRVRRTVEAFMWVDVDDPTDLPAALEAKAAEDDSYVSSVDLQVTGWWQEGSIEILDYGVCGA